jgi:hypothetical protein
VSDRLRVRRWVISADAAELARLRELRQRSVADAARRRWTNPPAECAEYDSPPRTRHDARERTRRKASGGSCGWVVERTFAWLGRYRRLSKDYPENVGSSEAWLFAAMTHILARRIAGT